MPRDRGFRRLWLPPTLPVGGSKAHYRDLRFRSCRVFGDAETGLKFTQGRFGRIEFMSISRYPLEGENFCRVAGEHAVNQVNDRLCGGSLERPQEKRFLPWPSQRSFGVRGFCTHGLPVR
jgi:hypothetical protein